MIRTPFIVCATLLIASQAPLWSQAPAAILNIQVDNYVPYHNDTPDYSKLASLSDKVSAPPLRPRRHRRVPGSRGQAGVIDLDSPRQASATEDPYYWRANGGATRSYVIHLLPAIRP